MNIQHIGDGVWLADGEGYDKPILAEGYTKEQAHEEYNVVYGKQYAEAQVATHNSMEQQ